MNEFYFDGTLRFSFDIEEKSAFIIIKYILINYIFKSKWKIYDFNRKNHQQNATRHTAVKCAPKIDLVIYSELATHQLITDFCQLNRITFYWKQNAHTSHAECFKS